jgi:hypothetical protein
MKKQRKHYTPEEKVAILRRHLAGGYRSRICVTNLGCSQLCSITLNRAAKSNVGTNHSKGSAFGRGRRCRSKMRGVWSRVTYSITTTFV